LVWFLSLIMTDYDKFLNDVDRVTVNPEIENRMAKVPEGGGRRKTRPNIVIVDTDNTPRLDLERNSTIEEKVYHSMGSRTDSGYSTDSENLGDIDEDGTTEDKFGFIQKFSTRGSIAEDRKNKFRQTGEISARYSSDENELDDLESDEDDDEEVGRRTPSVRDCNYFEDEDDFNDREENGRVQRGESGEAMWLTFNNNLLTLKNQPKSEMIHDRFYRKMSSASISNISQQYCSAIQSVNNSGIFATSGKKLKRSTSMPEERRIAAKWRQKKANEFKQSLKRASIAVDHYLTGSLIDPERAGMDWASDGDENLNENSFEKTAKFGMLSFAEELRRVRTFNYDDGEESGRNTPRGSFVTERAESLVERKGSLVKRDARKASNRNSRRRASHVSSGEERDLFADLDDEDVVAIQMDDIDEGRMMGHGAPHHTNTAKRSGNFKREDSPNFRRRRSIVKSRDVATKLSEVRSKATKFDLRKDFRKLSKGMANFFKKSKSGSSSRIFRMDSKPTKSESTPLFTLKRTTLRTDDEDDEEAERRDRVDVEENKTLEDDPWARELKQHSEQVRKELKEQEAGGIFSSWGDKMSSWFKRNDSTSSDRPYHRLESTHSDAGSQRGVPRPSIRDQLVNVKKTFQSYITDSLQTGKKTYQQAKRTSKLAVKDWAHDKTVQATGGVLQRVKRETKERLKQEGMCQCLKNVIDDLVDDFVIDLEDQIVAKVGVEFNNIKYKVDDTLPEGPFARVLFFILAWLRHTFYPVDLNIWQRLRTASFWIFYTLTVFPYFGIQQIWFMLTFCIIDRTDEFQLINFILIFKGLQSLTQGFVKGTVSYFHYYLCTNFGNEWMDECLPDMIQFHLPLVVQIVLFLVQWALIWVAFFMLPHSKAKGKLKQVHRRESDFNQHTVIGRFDFSKGGRLKYFMLYDLCIFLVCMTLYLAVDLSYDFNDWQRKSNFLMAEIVYGLLSLPFVILALPLFKNLLTRSRETGYNRYGRCVPHTDYVRKVERRHHLKKSPRATPTASAATSRRASVDQSPSEVAPRTSKRSTSVAPTRINQNKPRKRKGSKGVHHKKHQKAE